MVLREVSGYMLAVNPHASDEILLDEALVAEIQDATGEVGMNALLNGLHRDEFIPLSAQWELLDKCSFKCPFCYIVGHSENRVPRFRDVQSYIDELIDNGLLFLQMTGGECTLHPDFLEMYTYIKRRGVLVEVYTNGSTVSPEMLAVFKEYKPYRVEVSIYGMTDDEVRINTGSKYKARLILDNILALRDAGIRIRCKTPVNLYTVSTVPRIEEWCVEHGIDYYYSTEVYDGHDGETLSEVGLPLNEVVRYEVKKLLKSGQELKGNSGPEQQGRRTAYTCAVSKYGFYIDSGFNVGLCSSVRKRIASIDPDIGILASLRKVQDGVAQVVGTTLAGCVSCEARGVCKSCPSDAIEEFDDQGILVGYRVDDSVCETTRAKYRGIVDALLAS